jgi:hypothetical protein
MAHELLHYYPDVDNDRVHVVGTPQFDPYADPSLRWTRAEFFSRIGADPSRKLICYSGGTANNVPDDPRYVAVLMEQIRTGRVKGMPQVLLRPCPSDEGSRYEGVRREYPELIYAQPSWHHTQPGNWAATLPTLEDVQFMANLTCHADLNINFASTMTLDFAIHDKPVINVAFDVTTSPRYGMPMWDYYQKWDHYQPVIDLGAARFARSADELAEHVNAYLDCPALDRKSRGRFLNLEVGIPVGQSTHRVIDVLQQIAY